MRESIPSTSPDLGWVFDKTTSSVESGNEEDARATLCAILLMLVSLRLAREKEPHAVSFPGPASSVRAPRAPPELGLDGMVHTLGFGGRTSAQQF